jgi:hypothetical protein
MDGLYSQRRGFKQVREPPKTIAKKLELQNRELVFMLMWRPHMCEMRKWAKTNSNSSREPWI